GVLLERGGHDLLRGLVQPGVDHLYPGVTKRPRHDLGPPVVPVQAGLGDDDPDGSHDFLPRGCAAGWPPPATYPCYEAGRRRGGWLAAVRARRGVGWPDGTGRLLGSCRRGAWPGGCWVPAAEAGGRTAPGGTWVRASLSARSAGPGAWCRARRPRPS